MKPLSRVKRFWRRRGYGIHSPFVYSLVRALYTGRSYRELSLYNELRERGVDRAVAKKLSITIKECGYNSWQINRVDGSQITICHNLNCKEVEQMVEAAEKQGTTVAIIPQNRQRYSVDNHPSTSIQAKGYTLLFNNRLPKQNFQI